MTDRDRSAIVPRSGPESPQDRPESSAGITPPDTETPPVHDEKTTGVVAEACNYPHHNRVRSEGPAAGAALRCKRYGPHAYHIFDDKITEGTYCRTNVYIERNTDA
jgi:hypothetical protein